MEQPEFGYSRRAANALMWLRRLSLLEVCAATGIGESTLKWFLSGKTDILLSDDSFHSLFSHLGVVATDEGARFEPNRVHYLHLGGGLMQLKRHMRMFRLLAPLMENAEALVLPRQNKVVPIMVKGKSVRMVLLVRGARFGARLLPKLGLQAATLAEDSQRVPTPPYCLDLLLTQQVKRRYFDLIFNGKTQHESMELVRIAALDRDITISEILDAVVRGRRTDPAAQVAVGSPNTQRRVLRLVPSHFEAKEAA